MDSPHDGLFYPDKTELMLREGLDISSIYVEPPIKYSLDDLSDNTVIEGERGTGKTIMLTNLKMLYKNNQSQSTNVLPIFIKPPKTFFETLITNRHLREEEKAILTLEFFNVWCLNHMSRDLLESPLQRQITPDIHSIIIREFFSESSENNFYSCINSRLVTLQNCIINQYAYISNIKLVRTESVHLFINKLNEELIKRQKKPITFLFLIDDFHLIPPEIQKYIVCVFGERSPYISFKIAVKNLCFATQCYPRGQLEKTHDFNVFNSNPLCNYSTEKQISTIVKYFTDMADSQLARRNLTLKQLLGNSKSLTEIAKNFRAKLASKQSKSRLVFYGIENLVSIASGNARIFFRFIEDIYVDALSKGYTLSSNQPIPPNIQNDVIHKKSKHYLQELSSYCYDDPIHSKKADNIPLGTKLKAFIEGLAFIFRHRLTLSIESNATIAFYINNESLLTKNSKFLLMEAIKFTCLQQINLRKSKTSSTSSPVYAINGRLIPALGLIPLRRWLQPIDANDFNLIKVDATTEKEFQESIIKFRQSTIKKFNPTVRHSDEKQTMITDFFGD